MANELKIVISGDGKNLQLAIQGADASLAGLGKTAKQSGADMDAALGRSSDQIGRLNDELDAGATAMGRMSQAARNAGVAIGEGFDVVADKAKTVWEEVKTHYERVLLIWGVALATGIAAAVLGTVYAVFKGISFAIGLLTGESYKSANIDALIAANKEVKELQALLPLTAVGASALNEALKGQGLSAATYAQTLNAVRTAQEGNGEELDRLGVKYKDQQGRLLSTNEVLANAAVVLAKYAEGWDRARAAQALGLGTEKQIQDALGVTAEKTEAAKERLIAYTLIIGQATQEAVARYEAAMKAFNNEADLTSQGFKKAIADNIMPALTDLAEFFREGFPDAVNVFRAALATVTSSFYILKTGVYVVTESIVGSVYAIGSVLSGVASAVGKAMAGDFAGAKNDLVEGWTQAKDRLREIGTNIADMSHKSVKAMALAINGDSIAAKTAVDNIKKVGDAWKGKPDAAKAGTAGQASDYDRLSQSIEREIALADAELNAGQQLNAADKFRIQTLGDLAKAYAAGKITLEQWDTLYDRAIVGAEKRALTDNTTAANKYIETLKRGNAETQNEIDTGQALSAAQKVALNILAEITNGTHKYTEAKTLEITADIELSIVLERVKAQRLAQIAADEKAADALAQDVDALRKANHEQALHNQEIGLTQQALNALVLKRQDEAIAIQQSIVAESADAVARGEMTAAMKLQIDKLDELQRKRGLTATGQDATLIADAAKKAEDAYQASVKKIEDGLYDAASNGFASGIKKAFGDIKQWLARQVISFAVQPFAQFGASLLNPGAASAGAGGGGLLGNGLSFLGSGSDLFNSAGSFGGLFSSNAAYGAALGTTNIGVGSQAALLAEQTGAFGAAGLQATASAASGASALAGAGAAVEAGAGVATAAETAALVAEGYGVAATTAAGVGTAAGAAAGAGLTGALAAIPVYGWIALAALAIFSASGGGKPTATTGQSGIAVDELGKITDNGPHQYEGSAGSLAAVTNLSNAYGSTARSLGIKAAPTEFFYDGNTGKDGEHPNFALSGGVVGKGGYAIGETPVSDAAISLAVSRAVFGSLKNSELPKYLAGVFDGLTASTATQQQITDTLASAQAFKALHDQLQLLPFAELKDLGFAAAKGLADASGSLAQLTANLTTYYDKFLPQTEKTAQITANVSKVLAGLNLPMVKLDESGRAMFRTLVEGRDLSTAAGQKEYAALLGVAGALDQLLPPLDQAREGIKGLAQQLKEQAGWQDKLDVLLGKTTSREISLRNDLADASNDTIKALIKQVYAQEDLKAAAEQAAAAQAKAADEAKRAADSITSTWKTITDTILDEVKRLRGEIVGTGHQGYAAAQAEFAITTAQARAGDQDAAKLLPGLSRNLDTLAQANAGTLLELRRMQAQTASSLAGTAGVLGGVSAGQAAAAGSAGRPVATVVGAGAATASQAAPQGSSKYTEKYQLPTGISYVQVTDAAAVARYDSINAAITEIGVATPEAVQRLAATAKQYGVSMFELATASGYLYSDVKNVFAKAGVPAFASGGLHAGGARIVGENGPELEVTGPSRIFNAPQIASALRSAGGGGGGADTGRLESLVEQLTQEVAALRADAAITAAASKSTFETLRRVTRDGNAMVTTT